jgi:hypothetical protein
VVVALVVVALAAVVMDHGVSLSVTLNASNAALTTSVAHGDAQAPLKRSAVAAAEVAVAAAAVAAAVEAAASEAMVVVCGST